jgi:CheY-like chemotaxis protein
LAQHRDCIYGTLDTTCGKALLIVCAWCNRVRSGEGDWKEHRHVRDDHKGETSHGVCPECAETVTRELDRSVCKSFIGLRSRREEQMNFVPDQKNQLAKNSEAFPTILVAGNDGRLRDMIRTLELGGYLVLKALDAADALRIVKVHSRLIHLLLMDVSLNGLALAETLTYMPGMQLLVVTGDLETTLAQVRQLLKRPMQKAFSSQRRIDFAIG